MYNSLHPTSDAMFEEYLFSVRAFEKEIARIGSVPKDPEACLSSVYYSPPDASILLRNNSNISVEFLS